MATPCYQCVSQRKVTFVPPELLLLGTSHVQVHVHHLYRTTFFCCLTIKKCFLLFCFQCSLQILKYFIAENTLTSIAGGILEIDIISSFCIMLTTQLMH